MRILNQRLVSSDISRFNGRGQGNTCCISDRATNCRQHIGHRSRLRGRASKGGGAEGLNIEKLHYEGNQDQQTHHTSQAQATLRVCRLGLTHWTSRTRRMWWRCAETLRSLTWWIQRCAHWPPPGCVTGWVTGLAGTTGLGTGLTGATGLVTDFTGFGAGFGSAFAALGTPKILPSLRRKKTGEVLGTMPSARAR